MPIGLFNIVDACYFFVDTHATIGQTTAFLHFVICGVLQGCPLSGSLFALSVEPLCQLRFVVQVQEGGAVRACADDIGIAIVAVKTLIKVDQVFSQASL